MSRSSGRGRGPDGISAVPGVFSGCLIMIAMGCFMLFLAAACFRACG